MKNPDKSTPDFAKRGEGFDSRQLAINYKLNNYVAKQQIGLLDMHQHGTIFELRLYRKHFRVVSLQRV